jgi:hypothetical protein
MRRIAVMVRAAVVTLLVTTVACDKPEPPEANLQASIRKEIEEAARRVVEQKEDWAERAEFRIYKVDDMWRVTAWRVVHPEAKGNKRYVPWGARTMLIDRNYHVQEYRSGAK